MKKKRAKGRPTTGHAFNATLQLRHRKEQKTVWEAAAEASKMSVTDWIRQTLDAAAAKENRR